MNVKRGKREQKSNETGRMAEKSMRRLLRECRLVVRDREPDGGGVFQIGSVSAAQYTGLLANQHITPLASQVLRTR